MRRFVPHAIWALVAVVAFLMGANRGADQTSVSETGSAPQYGNVGSGDRLGFERRSATEGSGGKFGSTASVELGGLTQISTIDQARPSWTAPTEGILSLQQVTEVAGKAFNSSSRIARDRAFAKLLSGMSPETVPLVLEQMITNSDSISYEEWENQAMKETIEEWSEDDLSSANEFVASLPPSASRDIATDAETL